MDFFERYKKIILIILFLSATIGLGFLIFIFFFKPILAPEIPTVSETNGPSYGFPKAATGTNPIEINNLNQNSQVPQKLPESKASNVALGGLTKTTELNQNPSLAPTLSKDGSSLDYYDQNQGKFFRINQDGQISTLDNTVFHNAQKITWSGDKDKVIIEYPDETKIVYNFDTKKQVTLPKHWKDFDFSPDSSQIVGKSIGLDPDNRWLIVSDTDGGKITAWKASGTTKTRSTPSGRRPSRLPPCISRELILTGKRFSSSD
jgi:hypothetical protein